MNKKKLTAILLIILLVVFGIVFYFTQNKSNLNKKKLYDFSEYNYLSNNLNLVGNQEDVDDDILNKIKIQDYTLNDPLVVINPYEISPLTAIVGFKTDKKMTVKVTIEAKPGGKDLVYETKEATTHYIPILGLYLDYDNQVKLELSNGTTNTISMPVDKDAQSEMLYFPDIEYIDNKLSEEDNDFYFFSTPIGGVASAYDQTGEIRWYLTNQVYKQVTELKNGRFLLSSPESLEDQSLGFLEVDLLGKVYNSYELNKPYYHNYVELPNGNILYSTPDEKIVELNLKNGNVAATYDLFEMLSDIDSTHTATIKDKLKNINSLDYDTKTDSILVGLQYYSTLININKNGKIEWMLANPEYYSKKFDKYLLKGTGSDFVYPKGNTNAKLKNGVLTLINNGWDLTDTWACSTSTNLSSSANEYKIDSSKKTITNISKYGDNHFSFTFGDYQTEENEKTIMFGREFRSFEEDMTVCKLSDEGDFFSEVITIKDDQEVFKMGIANTYNFVKKMPIYTGNYNFSKVNPKSFTADQAGDTYKVENYQDKFNKSILYTLPVELNGNKLDIMFDEDNYNIVLLDEYGKGYIYDVKNRQVNLTKGTGKNLIIIEHDGNIYNTGYYISI